MKGKAWYQDGKNIIGTTKIQNNYRVYIQWKQYRKEAMNQSTEPIQKLKIRSNNFCYCNVGRFIIKLKTSQILPLQYWKKIYLDWVSKIISHFSGTNTIYVNCIWKRRLDTWGLDPYYFTQQIYIFFFKSIPKIKRYFKDNVLNSLLTFIVTDFQNWDYLLTKQVNRSKYIILYFDRSKSLVWFKACKK